MNYNESDGHLNYCQYFKTNQDEPTQGACILPVKRLTSNEFKLLVVSFVGNCKCLNSCVRSYIRYSAICAQAVREALKPQFKAAALRNAEANVKVVKRKTT